jgi:hypothetical protein
MEIFTYLCERFIEIGLSDVHRCLTLKDHARNERGRESKTFLREEKNRSPRWIYSLSSLYLCLSSYGHRILSSRAYIWDRWTGRITYTSDVYACEITESCSLRDTYILRKMQDAVGNSHRHCVSTCQWHREQSSVISHDWMSLVYATFFTYFVAFGPIAHLHNQVSPTFFDLPRYDIYLLMRDR